MDRTLFDRLRFLLAGLREPAPSHDSERRALEAFKRLWPARERRSPVRQGSGLICLTGTPEKQALAGPGGPTPFLQRVRSPFLAFCPETVGKAG